MKKYTLILISLVLGVALAFGQDSKVMTGSMALNEGDLEKAIESFELALSNPEKIRKQKNIPKAHILLAKAYNQAAIHPLLQKNYPDASLLAFKNWKKAKETDSDKKWTKDIEAEKAGIFQALYNSGIGSYNTKNYEEASKYFAASSEIDPAQHSPAFMAGLSSYFINDTLGAMKNWEAAISRFETKGEVTSEDSMMSSAYRMLAHSLAFGPKDKKDVDKSLALLTKARESFEWDENLQLLELDIFNNNPEYFENAKEKFETAIDKNPENKQIKSAYARLLRESGDEKRAFELYEDILKQDPNDFVSNANLGDHFVTKAKVINQELLDGDFSDEKRESMEGETNNLLKEAYGYYLKAYDSQPDNFSLVSQLAYISTFVPELLPDAKKWSDKLKEIKGSQPATDSSEKSDGGE